MLTTLRRFPIDSMSVLMKLQEFPRGDDAGILPLPWEVPVVTGHEELSAGDFRTLQEAIVGFVTRD